jgi:hypothetical protein
MAAGRLAKAKFPAAGLTGRKFSVEYSVHCLGSLGKLQPLRQQSGRLPFVAALFSQIKKATRFAPHLDWRNHWLDPCSPEGTALF